MTLIQHSLPGDGALVRDLLKSVSRSFYLTLHILPRRVRAQVGLSYLFARAADTIADTDLIDRPSRLLYLKRFRAQFSDDAVSWEEIRTIQAALVPCQTESAERTLLARLEDCFRLYRGYIPEDRARIRRLMDVLPNGMEMDLALFPGDSARDLTALQTMEDLDRYVYYVAGCVGEFWTGMMCAHLPSLSRWDVSRMSEVGVRFGKGLQLVNVLKDVARDVQRGRCYIPQSLLREAGVEPKALLRKESLSVVRPVLLKLAGIALEHLDQGWLYTIAIPRRELRLRLACMWPILFGGATLQVLTSSADWLDPAGRLKISKGRVRRIMALTILTAGCGSIGTAYWSHLRKQVV